ncbi:MAG: hypothetical protein NT004_13105 [Bacteroidetes bacterium]|nr:hypothetical protein [Bacteroidota bacterium]
MVLIRHPASNLLRNFRRISGKASGSGKPAIMVCKVSQPFAAHAHVLKSAREHGQTHSPEASPVFAAAAMGLLARVNFPKQRRQVDSHPSWFTRLAIISSPMPIC